MFCFAVLHAHQFPDNEFAATILSARLGDDPTPYLIIGTALVVPNEVTPCFGRILVFKWTDSDRQLSLVFERAVKGACYAMALFQNSKLVVTVNNNVSSPFYMQ